MFLDSVKSVSLSPSLSTYSPSTLISCSSDGNPRPTYKWQVADSLPEKNETWKDIPDATGNEFTINKATTSYYRCVASNIVKRKTYTEVSHTFQINYISTGNLCYNMLFKI